MGSYQEKLSLNKGKVIQAEVQAFATESESRPGTVREMPLQAQISLKR